MSTRSLRSVVYVALLYLCSMAAIAGGGMHSSTVTSTGNWVFSDSFEVVDEVPLAIRIYPASWGGVWIGAHQQFTAVVTNANGRPLDGQTVLWSTTHPADVAVDETGFATALRDENFNRVEASAGVLTGSSDVSFAHDGDTYPGLMYTVWFARSDSAPALLVNGKIQVPNLYAAPAYATTPWPANRPTIAKFQWEGDRIGLLTDVANGAGTFRARDRFGEWTNLAIANAVDFQLEGDRIALLQDDGQFRVKDGINGAWTVLAGAGSGIRSFQLAGNYIGLLFDNGEFRVKEGVSGPWTILASAGSGARSFQMEGNYIALLHDSGLLRIKEGINGPWTNVASAGSGIDLFKIAVQSEYDENDNLIDEVYIGTLDDNGGFLAKRGINGPWVPLATAGVADFQFQANPHRDASIDEIRIGALHEDGTFRVKEGVNGPWSLLAAAGTGVVSFQLQGNLIGEMFDDGRLRVKEDVNGTWDATVAYGPDVTQYRLLVDVPVPPHRTTFFSYFYQQDLCTEQSDQGYLCYPEHVFALPVDDYGRFCGADIPGDWDWATGQGPIDGLDETCHHHDNAAIWYPEGGGPFDYWDSCIVRYALRYSRLTDDGILLTYGADDQAGWDAGWGTFMPHLKDALDVYFDYVRLTCSDSDLLLFEQATASQN